MKTFLLPLAILLLSSCSKKKTQPQPGTCPNFTPGIVLTRLNDTGKIEDAFTLFNALHLPITEMSGFYYTSPYPADSIPSLKAFLSAKSYINDGVGYTAYVYADTHAGGVVTLSTQFYGMNQANQQDWINTKKALGLTEPQRIDSLPVSKYTLVKVLPGEENYWVGVLTQEPILASAGLDCLYLADPPPHQ